MEIDLKSYFEDMIKKLEDEDLLRWGRLREDLLEKINHVTSDCDSHCGAISVLEKWQKEVNEKLEYLEKMEMSNRENIFRNRPQDGNTSATPHKCPICVGAGKVFVQLHPMANIGLGSKYKMDEQGRCYMVCETCEGKSIIWG